MNPIAKAFFIRFIDPSLRMPRSAFALAWMLLSLVQPIGYFVLFERVEEPHLSAFMLSVLFVLVCSCIVINRLHDMGLSGWWYVPILVLPVLALVGGLLEARIARDVATLDPDRLYVALVTFAVVVFVPALWLFSTPGEEGINAYGPPMGFEIRAAGQEAEIAAMLADRNGPLVEPRRPSARSVLARTFGVRA